MEHKQQKSLNEAIQRVVLGEAKTPSQADVDKALKTAMKMVDDAKKRVVKKTKKYVQSGININDYFQFPSKWKLKKNRSKLNDVYELQSSNTASEGTWTLLTFTPIDENEIQISWADVNTSGENYMQDFKGVVEDWENDQVYDIKHDAEND
jgi:hypothetical protein